ncbi:hypothetical protein ES319_A04G108900v1 [Gossypium barbadense]|uniref:PP4R3 EVH1-like domain-containing protein n=3 Tax=Gossypium TaxID=3633 RepID=A0A5J5W521_GOSBA|nr:hypothetical protein ES319_A04G108900v1 [Gossypium barbadense]TYH22363.1 hypothetical protein ES288_A04G122600v1 [Gossypium darwinii]TYI33288.1 hypothetical protein ES332_A04G123000v1 [Gossypium tomentosum]TYI33289.1 hypothetical protein ES332_A04G123000v1 [Gossypium tomentosum]
MGAQEKSQGNSNSLQRVKVYRLNEDGKWDDQGTGHVSVDYLERSEELALYVFDQEDNETLLVHRICPDDIYRKQEGTRSVMCNEIYISVLSTVKHFTQ